MLSLDIEMGRQLLFLYLVIDQSFIGGGLTGVRDLVRFNIILELIKASYSLINRNFSFPK